MASNDITERESETIVASAMARTVVEGVSGEATVREGSAAETRSERMPVFCAAPEGSSTAPHSRINLPFDIVSRYDWVRDLNSQGAEADLCLLRDHETGELAVLKFYRRGMRPDPLVVEEMRGADPRHMVRLIGYHDDGRDVWELQEYYRLGSLRDYMDEFPVLPEDERLAIVSEIAEAIEYLQNLGGGISHRDIKPSNILIKSLYPMQLVLTDFGLAQVQRHITHLTARAQGTWLYAAPEVHNREASPKSDWFSLGAIAYELYTGHPLFSQPDGNPLSASDALVRCVKGDYSSEGIDDERWALLVDGLTVYDRVHRWGYSEVRAWLGGESPSVFTPIDQERQHPRPYSFQPAWSSALASTPEELAALMRESWSRAAREWMGRPPETTLAFLARFGLEEEARRIALLPEHPDAKLIRLQQLLDPSGPVVYKGRELSTESIRGQIERCVACEKDAEDWLFDIFDSNILGVLAEMRSDATLGRVAFRLREWKRQVNTIMSIVPVERKALAEKALRVYLPELIQSAFELGGDDGDA